MSETEASNRERELRRNNVKRRLPSSAFRTVHTHVHTQLSVANVAECYPFGQDFTGYGKRSKGAERNKLFSSLQIS